MNQKKTVLSAMLLLSFLTLTLWANPKVQELASLDEAVFYPPQVFKQTLDSGMQVYYVQDQSLPIYQVSAFVRVGRIHETTTTRGLADLLVRLWPLGGTAKHQADELTEQFENLGAEINSDVYQEFLELHLTTLEKYKNQTFELFFDLLQTPQFDEKKLQNIKSKIFAGIDLRNEKPNDVAGREFQQILFGEMNPIAWKSSPETIQALSQDVLKNFYLEHAAPNQVTLVAKGPDDFLVFLQQCEKAMANWQTQPLPNLPYPNLTFPDATASKQWIQMPSKQSAVMMGHLSVPRTNPDKIKIAVLNSILGNGVLSSRLGNRIRTELGLVYDISSQVTHHATTGIFTISAMTNPDKVMLVIDEMQKVFKEFVENDDITELEFNNTKNKILNQSIFQYEKPFNWAMQNFLYDAYGYEKDYLEKYYTTLKSMTLAEAKAVLKTYFHPDQLKILVVGDRSQVKESARLKEFKNRELDKE